MTLTNGTIKHTLTDRRASPERLRDAAIRPPMVCRCRSAAYLSARKTRLALRSASCGLRERGPASRSKPGKSFGLARNVRDRAGLNSADAQSRDKGRPTRARRGRQVGKRLAAWSQKRATESIGRSGQLPNIARRACANKTAPAQRGRLPEKKLASYGQNGVRASDSPDRNAPPFCVRHLASLFDRRMTR